MLKKELLMKLEKLKNNPLVEGIVLQIRRYPLLDKIEPILSEDHIVWIVCNDDKYYIEKTTGIDYFKNTHALNYKINNLYLKKIAYEGGIESPDIVPNKKDLFVNFEAAKCVTAEMNHLNHISSDVYDFENKKFEKFLRKQNDDINSDINNISTSLKSDIRINKTSRHIFETSDINDSDFECKSYILFNRYNDIRLCTKEELKSKKLHL